MGTGTIVIGLASVIIGEVIFGNRFNFLYKLSSIVMGSIIFQNNNSDSSSIRFKSYGFKNFLRR